MTDIIWPQEYLPGTMDNYVSNEIIVPGIGIDAAWRQLNHPLLWPTYYGNASDVVFHGGAGPELRLGTRFRFTTFGFLVEAEVVEHEPPSPGKPARIAWHGWVEGDADNRLDVIHAWILEELPGNRLRILTQESQLGKPAKQLPPPGPTPCSTPTKNGSRGLLKAPATILSSEGGNASCSTPSKSC